jgi:hypothetical protein
MYYSSTYLSLVTGHEHDLQRVIIFLEQLVVEGSQYRSEAPAGGAPDVCSVVSLIR